jgi:hypothetical protein
MPCRKIEALPNCGSAFFLFWQTWHPVFRCRTAQFRCDNVFTERGVLGHCHVDEVEVVAVLHDVDGPLARKVKRRQDVTDVRCDGVFVGCVAVAEAFLVGLVGHGVMDVVDGAHLREAFVHDVCHEVACELWLLVFRKLGNHLGSDAFRRTEETVLCHHGCGFSVIPVGDSPGNQVVHDGVVHLAFGAMGRRVLCLCLCLDTGIGRLEGGERLRGMSLGTVRPRRW